MVAISVDELEDSSELAEEQGLTMPLASDPGGAVIKAYGVWDQGNEIAWPALFLVVDGTVAWRDLTRDYKKRPPVEDVLAAIDGHPTKGTE